MVSQTPKIESQPVTTDSLYKINNNIDTNSLQLLGQGSNHNVEASELNSNIPNNDSDLSLLKQESNLNIKTRHLFQNESELSTSPTNPNIESGDGNPISTTESLRLSATTLMPLPSNCLSQCQYSSNSQAPSNLNGTTESRSEDNSDDVCSEPVVDGVQWECEQVEKKCEVNQKPSSNHTVITFGTFDLFHLGHLLILERAAQLGSRLIVGVSSDALTMRKKGKKPIFDEHARLQLVKAVNCVSEVFLENSLEEKREYCIQHNATLFVMGDDHVGRFDKMLDGVCECHYLPRTKGVSSTDIEIILRDRLQTTNNNGPLDKAAKEALEKSLYDSFIVGDCNVNDSDEKELVNNNLESNSNSKSKKNGDNHKNSGDKIHNLNENHESNSNSLNSNGVNNNVASSSDVTIDNITEFQNINNRNCNMNNSESATLGTGGPDSDCSSAFDNSDTNNNSNRNVNISNNMLRSRFESTFDPDQCGNGVSRNSLNFRGGPSVSDQNSQCTQGVSHSDRSNMTTSSKATNKSSLSVAVSSDITNLNIESPVNVLQNSNNNNDMNQNLNHNVNETRGKSSGSSTLTKSGNKKSSGSLRNSDASTDINSNSTMSSPQLDRHMNNSESPDKNRQCDNKFDNENSNCTNTQSQQNNQDHNNGSKSESSKTAASSDSVVTTTVHTHASCNVNSTTLLHMDKDIEAEKNKSFLSKSIEKIMYILIWLHDVYYLWIQTICSPFCKAMPREMVFPEWFFIGLSKIVGEEVVVKQIFQPSSSMLTDLSCESESSPKSLKSKSIKSDKIHNCFTKLLPLPHSRTLTVFTANIVTYGRTSMTLLICYLLMLNSSTSNSNSNFNWSWQIGLFIAFLVMFHDFLDHMDGVVAKVQREDGRAKDDDGRWGGFVDAQCDKVVFITCLWTLLVLNGGAGENPSFLSSLLNLLLVFTCLTLIGLESSIAWVRSRDYFQAIYASPDGQNSKTGALRAISEGKLKQKMESVGVAFLSFLSPGPIPGSSVGVLEGKTTSYIVYWSAIFTLWGAIYFAFKSLEHKLKHSVASGA